MNKAQAENPLPKHWGGEKEGSEGFLSNTQSATSLIRDFHKAETKKIFCYT